MTVFICLDDNNGMMFNRRRQSRDKAVTDDINASRGERTLYMSEYSAKLFAGAENICAGDAYLSKAGDGDLCFDEGEALLPHISRIDRIVVYKWNREYPSDVTLDIDLPGNFRLCETCEFVGNSHEKITKEIYVK